MTLVIGTICSDGIVVSYDDRVVNMSSTNSPPSSERKVFHIGNDVYVGISGQWIPNKIPDFLIGIIKKYVNLNPPYAIHTISKELIEILRVMQDNVEMHEGFIIALMVIGYDRDKNNKTHKPHLFVFASNDGYEIVEDSILTIGADLTVDQLDRLEVATTSLSEHAHKTVITEVSMQNLLVGDKVDSIIIRPTRP